MSFFHESLNIKKYVAHTTRIYNTLRYMLIDPCPEDWILQVNRDPANDKIRSVIVNTHQDVNQRLKWHKSKDTLLVGTLTCTEIIECKEDENYARTFFSFDFRPTSSSDIKAFRIDYKPKQQTPLHAHDLSMDEEKHLTFPENISLDLGCIDFGTVMMVIAYYISHSTNHPLFYGEKYNPMILK